MEESKVMQEAEFIDPKIVLNVWDKEMISNIMIDSSINRSSQEAGLFNTGNWHSTLNH